MYQFRDLVDYPAHSISMGYNYDLIISVPMCVCIGGDVGMDPGQRRLCTG